MELKFLVVIADSPVYFMLTQISGPTQICNSYYYLQNSIKIPFLKLMFRAMIVNYTGVQDP